MSTRAQKLIWLLAVAGGLLILPARADSIVNSPHDLSVNGPGPIKAATNQNLCVFCHTAHKSNGAQPLWNHALSAMTNYVIYQSATLQAVVGQPDGSSRLCLSCHDGTIALGLVGNGCASITMQNGVKTMPIGPSNLGTDLSADHPVSFTYNTALAQQDSNLKDPSTLTGSVKLDRKSEMQCTSCHDPHNNHNGNFLVMDNTGSALCLACHNVDNWSGSAHSMSTQPITPAVKQALMHPAGATASAGVVSNARTVAAAACESCHVPHFAASKERLMRAAKPEDTCFACHSANRIAKDVATDFEKISRHILAPVEAHESNENPINPPKRHVTCADCHNPHATTTTLATSTRVAGPLTRVLGIGARGQVVPSVSREYELCFRCHGDSIGQAPSLIRRQFPGVNKRVQFSIGNQSFHPLETLGRNPNVPSLILPWRRSSTVGCRDCHNSDDSPQAGGTGANGPHGSIYAPLLERKLVLIDYQAESEANYALCYKCHSRESILNDESFRAQNKLGQDRGHRFHVVDAKAACTTCHDSHGVAGAKNLINFNTEYVTPSATGRLGYTSTGISSGNCTLTCHGVDHSAAAYPTPTIRAIFGPARRPQPR